MFPPRSQSPPALGAHSQKPGRHDELAHHAGAFCHAATRLATVPSKGELGVRMRSQCCCPILVPSGKCITLQPVSPALNSERELRPPPPLLPESTKCAWRAAAISTSGLLSPAKKSGCTVRW
eukprot:scaffold76333_cov66-Phaeocystis_antarctica.AAC.3